MMDRFFEQGNLLRMMETLKKQMECVRDTWNSYAHNAQLIAVATQSLSVELSLMNLLEASGKGECEPPWRTIDVRYWKEWLHGFDTGEFWLFEELLPGERISLLPTDFEIHSTLMRHHVLKEKEEGRDDYDLKEDGLQRDNANALDFALGYVDQMSPYYAAEVAEDAVLQLGVTFEELERLMQEDNPQSTEAFVAKRKAGRKVVSCFLPEASTDSFREAFRGFMPRISTGDGKVLLGHQEYDRKYVFVLLYYRFIRAGLMHRKLNVSCYSQFIVSALGLKVNFPTFRKNMNNWMQKIDLYDCTFHELTREQIAQKRYHEQQLTLDEYEVWCALDKELGKAIEESGEFDGYL